MAVDGEVIAGGSDWLNEWTAKLKIQFEKEIWISDIKFSKWTWLERESHQLVLRLSRLEAVWFKAFKPSPSYENLKLKLSGNQMNSKNSKNFQLR